MIRTVVAAGAAALFLFSGCGSEEPVPEEPKTVDLSRFPAWVVSPEMEGYITAIGHACPHKRGDAAQRRIALLSAKAELAKQIGLFVDSALFRTTICNSDVCQSDMKSYSNQYARRRLEDIEIKEEWHDPKTGDLYIRIATKQGEQP